MMKEISSQKLAEILGCTAVSADIVINKISTDSRQIDEHSLFVALRGERFDAHDFVVDVVAKGCPLVVVDHLIKDVPVEKQFVVNDTLEAYGKIGAYNRSQFKGTVIGLTGSAGKTTTKEEIAFLLSHFAKTYATAGNHNNQIGVPQSLCELDMDARYAVIEMGMSSKGEISHSVNLVKPDIAVVTNVYPMHIEFFPNFEGIAEAKAEIFKSLRCGGYAIINEDTNFAALLEKRALENGAKVVKFGKNTHPAVELHLSSEGEHYLYNAWCTLSLVNVLGLDVNKAATALANFGALPGRGMQHQLKLPQGGSYTLIDDSYSGQPEAMRLGIEALDKMKTNGRKIVVLGKMAELGDTSKARHEEIGRVLADSSIDVVIGVKPEMKDMLAQLPAAKEQYYFENRDGVDEFLLNNILQNNDIVLIKGARYSSEMYKVTESLIAKGA